jgi:hypothetical protein
MRSWGRVCVGVCFFFLVACGNENRSGRGIPTFVVPELDVDRQAFLADFPLLDDSENEAPPRDPVSGRAPFGVLIHMPKLGLGSFCSLAHISQGFVSTNAHCVDYDSQPANYFAVFYNKDGLKRYERVVERTYVGDRKSNDVAVLRLQGVESHAWDTVGGVGVETRPEVSKKPVEGRQVVVWSFNPFEGNHSKLFRKFARPGMRFAPRRCTSSRTNPKITGIREAEGGEELGRMRIIASGVQESTHHFLDACDSRLVQGNSGSLITDGSSTSQILGVFHWVVPVDVESMGQFGSFEYQGNDNQAIRLSWEDLNHRDFFGVASDFGLLLAQIPGVF